MRTGHRIDRWNPNVCWTTLKLEDGEIAEVGRSVYGLEVTILDKKQEFVREEYGPDLEDAAEKWVRHFHASGCPIFDGKAAPVSETAPPPPIRDHRKGVEEAYVDHFKYPLREIEKKQYVGGGVVLTLSCGHTTKRKRAPKKSVRCSGCRKK